MSFRGVAVIAAAMLASVLPATMHAQRAQQAVSVKLLPPSPDVNQPLRYELNQPAYVAAFIVSPGEGVQMIYPLTISNEKLQWAGFHTESLFGMHFDDDAYDVVLGRSAWSYASYGAGYAQGPRYLYIIASRWPLDVSRFVHRPSTLQRTIGYDNARSFDSDEAFTALLNNAVSLGSDDSWDSDVYMLWAPSWFDGVPHSFQEALAWNMATRVIGCRNGSSMIVPLNYWFSGCPGDARIVLTRPVKPYVQKVASGVDAPTVLPTIKGVRMARQPESKTEPVVNGFLTTAAGGVTDDGVRLIDRGEQPSRVRTLTVVDEVPAVIVGRDVPRSESPRERETDHARDHRWGMHRAEPVVGSTPQLAPAPRLAPNPMTAPAPRMAPAPNVRPERMSPPRVERAEPAQPAPVMRSAPVHVAPPPPPPAQTAPSKVQ